MNEQELIEEMEAELAAERASERCLEDIGWERHMNELDMERRMHGRI